jgi:mannose-1-phosphate guanylyltransferase
VWFTNAHRHVIEQLQAFTLSGNINELQVLREAHRERQADVTLHLVQVDDPRAYGCVPTDGTGLVTAFLEKTADPVSRQVNAGCYVFTRRVVDEIPAGRSVSVEREIFPGLVAAGRRLLGVVDDAYWLDVGTPEALVRGSRDVVRGAAASPAYGHPPGEAWVAGSAVVDGARVTGGSAVSGGARLGRDALVDGSIVCADATVGAGATVTASVVGPAARVGAGAVLDRAVIGDGARVAAGCRLPAGARLECGAEVGTGAR